MESLNPEDLTVYPQQKLSAYSSPSVLNAKNAVTKFYDQPSWGIRPTPGGCDIISQNTDWSAIPGLEIEVISFAEAVCDTLKDAFTQEYRVVGSANFTSDQKKEFTGRAIGRWIPIFDEWNKVANNGSKFFIIKNQTIYDDLTRLSTTRRVKTNGRWAPGASDVSEAMSIFMNPDPNGPSAVEQVDIRNARTQKEMEEIGVSLLEIGEEFDEWKRKREREIPTSASVSSLDLPNFFDDGEFYQSTTTVEPTEVVIDEATASGLSRKTVKGRLSAVINRVRKPSSAGSSKR